MSGVTGDVHEVIGTMTASAGGLSRDDDGPVALALMHGILEHLPAAAAYVAGPDLVFMFANSEYQRIVGGRDLVGRPLYEALSELPKERVDRVSRVARTGEPFEGRESEVWIRQHGRE